MLHAAVKRSAGDHRNGTYDEQPCGRSFEKSGRCLRIEGTENGSCKTGQVFIAGSVQNNQVAEPAGGPAEAGRQNMFFPAEIIGKRKSGGS